MLHGLKRIPLAAFALAASFVACANAAHAQAGPFEAPSETAPAPDSAESPAPPVTLVVPGDRRAPLRTVAEHAERATLGHDFCVDSFQGLPGEGEKGGRLLILWRCHGRDNQYVALNDGVLFIGAERLRHIEPMPPPARPGCDWREASSLVRNYTVGLCNNGERAERLAEFRPDLPMRLGARGPAFQPGPYAGTPLVAMTNADSAPRALWEYVRQTKQLRMIGTNLCLTPPSEDMSEGAPLYLDDCTAPYQINPRHRRDGPRRARVMFDRYWR